MQSVHPERRPDGPKSKGQSVPDVRMGARRSASPTWHAVSSDGSTPLRYAHRERRLAIALISSLALAACGIRGNPLAPAQPSPSTATPHGGETGPTQSPSQRGPFAPLPPPDAGAAAPMPLPDSGTPDAGTR